LQWMCKQGMQPLVLTIPDPQGGRRVEFEKRRQTGMNLVPASIGALRSAISHLKRGGIVLTGIDRPVPDPKDCPRFFGRPAALPIHHAFLAAKAGVPVQIVVTQLQADRKYHVLCSEPIELEGGTALQNAEKVLSIAEDFIRQAPAQWSVPLAVWPEAVGLAPQS
jgi:lauroyl/myristoyl acyltransferase